MRIIDWSSDVCSSDLPALLRMKTGRSSCSSRTRMRALTAVWVRLRLAAAPTKLPVFTTSRNVRALAISTQHHPSFRSEERSVGNEGVNTCRHRWLRYPSKTINNRKIEDYMNYE